jgi:RimJ/RimL family protein N-acetyltransferase
MDFETMKQFVYKIAIDEYTDKKTSDDVHFVIFDNIFVGLKNIQLLVKRYNFSFRLIKILVKLVLKRNVLITVIFENSIVNDSLISFGKCDYYQIEKNDSIIGPIYTSSKYRGKGFATSGLSKCLEYLKHNHRIKYAYIDTSVDNLAMQSVIKKLNFILSAKSYFRS